MYYECIYLFTFKNSWVFLGIPRNPAASANGGGQHRVAGASGQPVHCLCSHVGCLPPRQDATCPCQAQSKPTAHELRLQLFISQSSM